MLAVKGEKSPSAILPCGQPISILPILYVCRVGPRRISLSQIVLNSSCIISLGVMAMNIVEELRTFVVPKAETLD